MTAFDLGAFVAPNLTIGVNWGRVRVRGEPL